MKKILILFITQMFFILTVSSMVITEGSSDFEVHEWGVFNSIYGENITNVYGKNWDSYIISIDKPVIYFHSENDLENVIVKVSNLFGIVTIPDALIQNYTLTWNVSVSKNMIVESTVGNVTSDRQYEYLFYEGKRNIAKNIDAKITNEDGIISYYVKNNEDYTISNIFLIIGTTYKDTY